MERKWKGGCAAGSAAEGIQDERTATHLSFRRLKLRSSLWRIENFPQMGLNSDFDSKNTMATPEKNMFILKVALRSEQQERLSSPVKGYLGVLQGFHFL